MRILLLRKNTCINTNLIKSRLKSSWEDYNILKFSLIQVTFACVNTNSVKNQDLNLKKIIIFLLIHENIYFLLYVIHCARWDFSRISIFLQCTSPSGGFLERCTFSARINGNELSQIMSVSCSRPCAADLRRVKKPRRRREGRNMESYAPYLFRTCTHAVQIFIAIQHGKVPRLYEARPVLRS